MESWRHSHVEYTFFVFLKKENFADTKGVIRSRNSKNE